MTVFVKLLRALGKLVLGLAVLAGLLHFLIISNLTGRLVNEDVYYAAIDGVDLYNRVYDEVLVDEALTEQTGNLLGGVHLDVHGQAVAALREILPPAYLQEQTEDNIGRFTAYMNGETGQLEIYLELEEPLERVLPTAQTEAARVIDALDIPETAESLCTPEGVEQLADDTAPLLQRLSDGRLPDSASSLRAGSPDCREQEFERWFDAVLSDPALDPQTALFLAGAREELRTPFVEGDTRGLLQVATVSLIGPLAEDAVTDLRGQLQPGDRLDLIQLAVAQNDDLTRGDIEESAESLRSAASVSNGLGKVVALVVVVVGSLLLALTYRSNLASALRWPGVVLALSGAVCLVVGYVLNLALPGILRETAEAGSYDSVAPSAVRLASDLLGSFGQQATEGFVLPTVTVMLVGAALVAASSVVSQSHRFRTVPQ